MPKIFVSYRRESSADIAGRLSDYLRDRFGTDNVFLDASGIPPTADFIEQIRKQIAESDLVIALVGRDWAGQARGWRSWWTKSRISAGRRHDSI
ncbi:MAG: TIR domain-containing protein [Sphingomonadales bacterium]|nr:TIR domain-containing protein [Sphingomonadales bacterium]